MEVKVTNRRLGTKHIEEINSASELKVYFGNNFNKAFKALENNEQYIGTTWFINRTNWQPKPRVY
jgi:hypothetical protein